MTDVPTNLHVLPYHLHTKVCHCDLSNFYFLLLI